MTTDEQQAHAEEEWSYVLNHGHRSRLAFLPSHDRCSVCRVPVGGVSSGLVKPLGIRRSRMSPHLCNV